MQDVGEIELADNVSRPIQKQLPELTRGRKSETHSPCTQTVELSLEAGVLVSDVRILLHERGILCAQGVVLGFK